MVCLYPSEFLDASCNQLRRLFAFLSDTFSGCLYSFYPASIRILAFFLKNSLYALNLVLFIISLLFYIMNVLAENHEVEEELAMVSKVNTELNNYMALSEKIAEDRERKRIAREIHDTLGHALTGISAGLDAVGVLIDIDPNRAKEQVKSVSEVVREGIQDVRGSLNRLRPGALEGRTLKRCFGKRRSVSTKRFPTCRLIYTMNGSMSIWTS